MHFRDSKWLARHRFNEKKKRATDDVRGWREGGIKNRHFLGKFQSLTINN